MTAAPRRPGVSLTEALIAIFIMAIGLIALLALFPIGAVNMARAVRDDRTAQLAANADNWARMFWRAAWLGADEGPAPETFQQMSVFGREAYVRALDNPFSAEPSFGPPWASTVTAFQRFDLDPQRRPAAPVSWPVFVDPIGWFARQGNAQRWLGGQQVVMTPSSPGSFGAGVPRRMIQTVDPLSRRVFFDTSTVQQRRRLMELGDDIGFTRGGDSVGDAGQVDRGGRYNYALLFQRFKQSARHEVNCHVVVYEGRSVDAALAEVSLPPVGGFVAPGATSLTVDPQGTRPPLRKGGWILLAGLTATGPQADPTPIPIAEFYRVTSINDVPNSTQLQLTLSEPVRATTGNQPYRGRVIFLEGVVEVFDRGTISLTAPPAP